jgi:small redox-active disulfide protein 2
MIVKVLGMGCSNCKKLEQNTKEALKELNLEAEVQIIEDIEEIMSYGIMSTPALMIDDCIVSSGQILRSDEIKKLIKSNSKENKKKDCDSSYCNDCC